MWTAVFSSDVCAPISSSINVCEDLQMLPDITSIFETRDSE